MDKLKGKVLVVGASGQLGGAVLEQLNLGGRDTLAFVRPKSSFIAPDFQHLETVRGDLADFDSVDQACSQAEQVIATVSSIVPGKQDRFGIDDIKHYENLLRACRKNHIRQLVYISAFPSPFDDQVPEFRIKRQIEQLIIASGVPYTIFRAAAFMDIYYAVMGSSSVMDGVAQPTLLRGYWLTRLYSYITSGLLEKRGIAILPGNGQVRQAFITVHDVAAFMIRALQLPQTIDRTIDLGGPELISWADVADVYATLLDRKVRKLTAPLWLLKLFEVLLNSATPAGSNMMSILSLLGRYEFAPDMEATCAEFDLEMMDSRSYLIKKLHLKIEK